MAAPERDRGSPSIRRSAWSPQTQALLAALLASMPAFVALLVNHRPKALRGRSLMEVMDTADRASRRGSPRSISSGAQPSADVSRVPVTGVCRDRPGARRRARSPRETRARCSPSCSPTGRCAPRVNMSEICAATPAAVRPPLNEIEEEEMATESTSQLGRIRAASST